VVCGARRADPGARAGGARIRGHRSTVTSRLTTPRWIGPGDVNGFLGLALDNITQLVLLAGLLVGVFRFPVDLVLYRMIPGTALGALAGNLAYTWLAVRLMRRERRDDVTAMPFGIDTPTLFAMAFGVLGPVMVTTGDPVLAWHVGMAVTVVIGLAKTALAFTGDWARRVVPRAALLGSIGGVAIALIAFLPALKLFADPLVGLVALVVLLLALFGAVRMPFGVPGAFAAVAAGALLFWARAWIDGSGRALDIAARVGLAVPWPTLDWLSALDAALPYLSIGLPFALVTVVGGIDNTESAMAAGDGYSTRSILLVEALATVLAGTCGGVIQNTPYIGHPAYKAMGARAGYTLATGLVIGVGAAVGALAALVSVLPEAAVAPILLFIGIEITAQAFLASPARHGAAVALTFVPVIAAVVVLQATTILAGAGRSPADLSADAGTAWQTLTVLANGFILSAVLWGTALAAIIDRRFATAALAFVIASGAVLVGLIHSPLPGGALFWPWAPPGSVPARLAGAYGILAVLCWVVARRRAM
jgi:AGZA family xanthine/uracil permease-like MFS transporter